MNLWLHRIWALLIVENLLHQGKEKSPGLSTPTPPKKTQHGIILAYVEAISACIECHFKSILNIFIASRLILNWHIEIVIQFARNMVLEE